MILERRTQRFKDYSTDSYVSTNKLIKLFDKRNQFKDNLLELFKIQEETTEVFQIGNAKHLLNSIISLDGLCEKIDINTKLKDIYLMKMLEGEKSIFEIYHTDNAFVYRQNQSETLIVETRYTAKDDLLNYFNFSKFANYCRDNKYDDLIDYIKEYLKNKNFENHQSISLRLVYKYEDSRFYLRAITSTQGYRDFGINFSVFVALVSLVEKSVKVTTQGRSKMTTSAGAK